VARRASRRLSSGSSSALVFADRPGPGRKTVTWAITLHPGYGFLEIGQAEVFPPITQKYNPDGKMGSFR
jgi:hypothetical protein